VRFNLKEHFRYHSFQMKILDRSILPSSLKSFRFALCEPLELSICSCWCPKLFICVALAAHKRWISSKMITPYYVAPELVAKTLEKAQFMQLEPNIFSLSHCLINDVISSASHPFDKNKFVQYLEPKLESCATSLNENTKQKDRLKAQIKTNLFHILNIRT